MDRSSRSVLDDLVDLDADAPSLPRLYSFDDPFEEVRIIVKTRSDGSLEDVMGHIDLSADSFDVDQSVLMVSPKIYPFVVIYDRHKGELILYRYSWIKPVVDLASLPPRSMRLEDILHQPEPPPQTRPSRPSLHRNPSSFISTKERRLSGAADPLDHPQRRAPRLSRGIEYDPPTTGELQSVLDPTPFAMPMKTAPSPIIGGKMRGLSMASRLGGEAERRKSGSASVIRHEMESPIHRTAPRTIGERDFRETTMMLGLEREEEGLRSDQVLQRIWVWKPPR